MTDKKSNESRRKLLKSIAAGGGAVIAGKSLPENWTRPVVDSVLLPAHALTSLEQYTSLISAQTENDSLFAKALDGLVPEAQAQVELFSEQTCISLNPDGSVKVEGLLDLTKNFIYKVTASQVWIGGDPVNMTITACITRYSPTQVRVTDISNGIARGYYLFDELEFNFYCPAGTCSAPACPPP